MQILFAMLAQLLDRKQKSLRNQRVACGLTYLSSSQLNCQLVGQQKASFPAMYILAAQNPFLLQYGIAQIPVHLPLDVNYISVLCFQCLKSNCVNLKKWPLFFAHAFCLIGGWWSLLKAHSHFPKVLRAVGPKLCCVDHKWSTSCAQRSVAPHCLHDVFSAKRGDETMRNCPWQTLRVASGLWPPKFGSLHVSTWKRLPSSTFGKEPSQSRVQWQSAAVLGPHSISSKRKLLVCFGTTSVGKRGGDGSRGRAVTF